MIRPIFSNLIHTGFQCGWSLKNPSWSPCQITRKTFNCCYCALNILKMNASYNFLILTFTSMPFVLQLLVGIRKCWLKSSVVATPHEILLEFMMKCNWKLRPFLQTVSLTHLFTTNIGNRLTWCSKFINPLPLNTATSRIHVSEECVAGA